MRHVLSEAFGPAREFRSPWRLVELLAAFDAADDTERTGEIGRTVRAWLPGVQLDPIDIAEDFEPILAKIDAVPDEARELDGWLLDLETVGRAIRSCASLGDAVPGALAEALRDAAARMDEAGPSWRARTWDSTLVASDARDDADVRPWTFVRSRTAQGRVSERVVDPTALEAWLDRTLHPRDAETLRTLVAVDGPWQQAYRAVVARESAEIYVPQRATRCTTTAAASPSELDWATPLAIVPTPHRGRVYFELWLGQGSEQQLGVLGRFDDEPPEAIAFTPADARAVSWGDEVLGRIQSTIHLLDTTTLEVLQDVARSIETLGVGELHPRAQPIACAAANDLHFGLGHAALAEAARVFTSGDDGTPDGAPGAAAVLRTRVALELAADRLQDDILDTAIERADAAIGVHANGLLLVEDRAYDEILGDEEPRADAWWGRPRAIAARVPFASLLPRAPELSVRPAPPRAAIHAAEPAASYRALAADSSGATTSLLALERVIDGDVANFHSAYRRVASAIEQSVGVWRDRDVVARIERLKPTDPLRGAMVATLGALCSGPNLVAVPVQTLAEALAAAGLDLAGARFEPAWGSVHDRLRHLDDLTARVDAQDIRGFAGAAPWLALAERMRLLIHSLPTSHASGVGKARTRCALAYVHAGELDRVTEILAPVSADGDSPEIAITRDVIELGVCIDAHTWERATALTAAIDVALASAGRRVREVVLGIARGTQGRALRHRGDAVGSIPLLIEARDSHAEHHPHELARSRIELAASLRAAGRADEALAQLDLAHEDLERTREYSRPYAEATSVYLEYERARALVELGAGLEAFAAAARALDDCPRGFWPRAGILRVLAWAHRLLGDTRAADACVNELRSLDRSKAPALMDRLIREARGMPRSGGEPY